MPDQTTRSLRLCAALLTTLSGATQVAMLWLRAIDETALLNALLGATYLLVGIGLFGRSRFSLCMAIAVPGGMLAGLLYYGGEPEQTRLLRMGSDLAIVLLSAVALWRVRHVPTP